MKNYILLLFVTTLFQVNAQIILDDKITNIMIYHSDELIGLSNAITVPEGKLWKYSYENNAFRVRNINDNGENVINSLIKNINDYAVLTEGYQIYFPADVNQYRYTLTIYEYNFSPGEALGFNDVEPLKDRIKLFPNPTTNQLALNSDKVYQIEVFDLAGNKVMELKGNTISVEHLSSATYIVNAIDLETKESLSYKVVKK